MLNLIYKFYTTVFAFLRAISSRYGDPANIPSELVPITTELHRKAQSYIDIDNRKNFTETCLEVWDLSSSLTTSTLLKSKYALPFRYNSERFCTVRVSNKITTRHGKRATLSW